MKRKLIQFISILFVLLFFCACSKDSGEPSATVKGDEGNSLDSVTIGFSVASYDDPFYAKLREGAESRARELGLGMIPMDAMNEWEKQIKDIEYLLQQDVDILIIIPTHTRELASVIEKANEANIPVITLDHNVDGGEVVAHVGSDQVAGGKMAGKLFSEHIEAGKVIELTESPFLSTNRERSQGLMEAIDHVRDVFYAFSETAGFDRTNSIEVTKKLLDAPGRIFRGILAHSDEIALGALEVFAEYGIEDITLIGFGGTDEAIQAVKDGRMLATISQNPELMGAMGVETAHKVLIGENVEEFIPVELEVIMKE